MSYFDGIWYWGVRSRFEFVNQNDQIMRIDFMELVSNGGNISFLATILKNKFKCSNMLRKINNLDIGLIY